MKRLVLIAGAALLSLVGIAIAAPTAEAAPLICVNLGFGPGPTGTVICIPPA